MRINKKLVKGITSEAGTKDSDDTYQSKEYVDVVYFAQGLAWTIFILFISFMVISFSVPVIRHLWKKPGPPPKVVTRVIHDSAYNQAQTDYVRACKDNTHADGTGGTNPGVPDVHTSVWTCTYAH